jgi:hypothetical protein
MMGISKKKDRTGGRPKTNDAEKLRHLVMFRVDDETIRKINDYVSESGKTQAEVMRNLIFQRKFSMDSGKLTLKEIALKLGLLADEVRAIEGKVVKSEPYEKSELSHDIERIKEQVFELAEIANKSVRKQ